MTAESPHPYDAQLPILAELEQTVHARALTLLSAPAPVPARRPSPRRVLRRAGLLAGVSGLVGASAFATHSLVTGDDGSGGDPSLRTTAAAELAGGLRDGERWTLSGARRGRDLCDALIVAGAVATRCGPAPGRDGLLLDGLLSPRGRWVVALAGPDVATVALRIGGRRRVVATRPVAAAAARASQLPAGLRWVVVALPRGRADAARVSARPLDRGGRALGPPQKL